MYKEHQDNDSKKLFLKFLLILFLCLYFNGLEVAVRRCIFSVHFFLRTPLDGCFWWSCRTRRLSLNINISLKSLLQFKPVKLEMKQKFSFSYKNHSIDLLCNVPYGNIQGRIQRFSKGVALYVGHYGWLMKKILGFRWSKKAKLTIETKSFWQNISISIFKFSLFLYAIKACQWNFINCSKFEKRFDKEREKK